MNSQIHNLLTKGVTRIIDRENLEKRLAQGDKLVVKLGIDPVASRIHIGHMIPFMKLRQFQEMGHTAVLLFGDATAQVGDTSDKDAERPMLTRAETEAHARAFLEKFSRVIDISKLEIYYNSEGLDAVNFAGVGELAKHFSVAEMLDRDNFSKRYKSGVRISLQEFLYPIMQGYDSVAIARKYGACDVELGGNDQYFNLLAGRTLMHAFGLPKQDIITTDLLIGTDGEKMSKSKPNCILIDDSPFDMYQKLINVRDDLILHYFELATDMTLEEVAVIKNRLESGEHPNTLKIELAQRVITMYHGKSYNASSVDSIETITIPSNVLQIIKILSDNGFFSFSYAINKLADKVSRAEIIQLSALAGGYVQLVGKMQHDFFNNQDGISLIELVAIVLDAVGEVPSYNGEDFKINRLSRLDLIGYAKRALELKIISSDDDIDWDAEPKFLDACIVLFTSCGFEGLEVIDSFQIMISDLLKYIGFCATSGDVRNALAGRSVRVDGVVIEDPKYLVTITADGVLVEMGKKKAKRVTI